MPAEPTCPRRLPARLVVALAAVLALVCALTSCNGRTDGSRADSADGAPDRSVRTPFDQTLYDRLPASVRNQGRIEVATDAGYPPAAFFDRDGRTIIGFEPDLAAALGRVLGVELGFVRMDFREALPALEGAEVDIVLAAMTDTPERRQRFDFVDYFSTGTSILVQRGNPLGILDLEDLCGQVVAAEEGTIQIDLLHRVQKSCGERRIVIRLLADNDGALLELRTGRAAAVLNDYPSAARLITDERTRADFQLASPVQYEPGFYGIAVRKDQPRLRDALREALDRLVRSGEYLQVLEKWGVSGGAVDQARVNGGS